MADSFFGFDTSISNLNDDEGGGGPSEDEYDALNDETFGQDADEFDWESQHEQLASELESSRLHNSSLDRSQTQLEASLSKLVVDEPDSFTINPNVWRHDPPGFPPSHTPAPSLTNVCTVEELERQIRQKQSSQPPQHNYFQPRFPVILQRPPGLQAPVPLPFAPQQQNMSINQSLNKIIGQNNQNVNQIGQSYNHMGQNMSQIGQNVNQMAQNVNHMGQNVNQLTQLNQSMNQMTNFQNNIVNLPMGQNQMLTQNNQMSQNMSPMSQNMNQMGQNLNQMGQNMNLMNHNPMIQNGNQFFPNMMGQSKMLAPQNPPGINVPRQSFSPSFGQFNPNFRGKTMATKPPEQQTIYPPNMLNQQQQQMLQQHMQQNHSPQSNKQQSPPNKKLQNQNQIFQNHNQTLQNHNQTHQNQNQTQQNQNQTHQNQNQKLQKTRTYSNSQNQKGQNQNLTSQNLVQLIQNTHPMLQFNNSFHNANHHPMLNNRNNVYNNYNQIINNRGANRLNGSFASDNSMLNGDDESIGSDGDEYAGLMSQREKQWLINIQMLQLNTGTPYIHDYYYTVFLERQSKKEKEGVKEAHKANQQNHPFYSGGAAKQEGHTRERHNSVRHNSTSEERTYVPLQFENSLGKLQCGSVTAPRKIIDAEVVGTEASPGSRAPSRASTHTPAEVPREMRRTKQLLIDIEALYLILLRIEELNDPLAISNALILKEREEKQKQLEAAQKEDADEDDCNMFLRNIESVQKRPKQDSPKSETVDKRQVVNLAVAQKPPAKNLLDEDKDDLINKMFTGLLHSDRLAQMLSVRKGRALVSRFVSRVPPTHSCLRGLWARILRALPSAARRDEGGLASLAVHYRHYVLGSSGWSAVLESCSHLSEALDPARTHTALMSSLTLSCVCALVEKAFTLVNTPDATPPERQWFRFLKTVARSLKHTTIPISRPLLPLSETKLLCHIKQLESRSTIEILQRGKSADFADLSKTEVSELLVKYLC